MVWWFFGLPFGSVFAPLFLSFSVPSTDVIVGMVVVFAGMLVLARRSLSY